MIALSQCERSLNPELVQENIIRQLEWHALQAKQSKWDVFFKSNRLNIMETSVVLLFLNVTTPTVTAVYWNRDAICEHSRTSWNFHIISLLLRLPCVIFENSVEQWYTISFAGMMKEHPNVYFFIFVLVGMCSTGYVTQYFITNGRLNILVYVAAMCVFEKGQMVFA